MMQTFAIERLDLIEAPGIWGKVAKAAAEFFRGVLAGWKAI